MIGVIILEYDESITKSESVPSVVVEDPVTLQGINLAYRNIGTAAVTLICPGYLIDEVTSVIVPSGGCRVIRAINGTWLTISQSSADIAAVTAVGGGPVAMDTTGAGPTSGTQSGWFKVVDAVGAVLWVPIWR